MTRMKKKKSGKRSYYAEHYADVIGKLILVFNIGYPNGRYQETNCNSKQIAQESYVAGL